MKLVCSNGQSSLCKLCLGTLVSSGSASTDRFTSVPSMIPTITIPVSSCSSTSTISIIDKFGPLSANTFYQIQLWGSAFNPGIGYPPPTLRAPYFTIIINGLINSGPGGP